MKRFAFLLFAMAAFAVAVPTEAKAGGHGHNVGFAAVGVNHGFDRGFHDRGNFRNNVIFVPTNRSLFFLSAGVPGYVPGVNASYGGFNSGYSGFNASFSSYSAGGGGCGGPVAPVSPGGPVTAIDRFGRLVVFP